MTASVGQYCLAVAVIAASAGVVACAAALRFGSPRWLRAARLALAAVAVLFTAALAALAVAVFTDQFQVSYVHQFSEKALPPGYKLSALWAGQEGSLLLWAWMTAALGLAAVSAWRDRPLAASAVAAAVLLGLCGVLASILLFAADPFAVWSNGAVPPDGAGMKPLLQNWAMIAHPPVLFLGYAAYAMPLALMAGLLAGGRLDRRSLDSIRRWSLLAWVWLGAGILLGCWWAYVTLGWGGYWSWDAVENASLLPWLAGSALLHALIAHRLAGRLKRATAVLAALPFLLCLLAAWVTRGGKLLSVHAFGPDSSDQGLTVGTMLLLTISVVTIGWIALLLSKFSRERKRARRSFISKETGFLAGAVSLLLVAAVVTFGTFWPLLPKRLIGDIILPADFYNRAALPIALAALALMAIGPLFAYGRRWRLSPVVLGLVSVVPAATICTVLLAAGVRSPWILAVAAVASTAASVMTFDILAPAGGGGPARKARCAARLAHAGMVLIAVGVAGSSVFRSDHVLRLAVGESAGVGGCLLTLERVDWTEQANYEAVTAAVSVEDAAGRPQTLRPGIRSYFRPRERNVVAAIARNRRGDDLYLQPRELSADKAVINVQVRPGVNWIWIGGLLLLVSGLIPFLPSHGAVGDGDPRTHPLASSQHHNFHG